MGRKQKPYQTSYGEIVPGLYRCVDGRWKILANGKRFTESDERLAVQRFRRECPPQSVYVPIAHSDDGAALAELTDEMGVNGGALQVKDTDGGLEVGYRLDGDTTWSWLRQLLIENPGYVSQQVGIPQLANLANFDLPKEPVKTKDIETAYRFYSTAEPNAKNRAIANFNRLTTFCNAKTLNDITEDNLVAFRQLIIAKSDFKSSGSIAQFFSSIRGVLRLASRGDLDAKQIEDCVARCKAKLYPPTDNVINNPQPISRADFHILLNNAPDAVWKAMLLLSLNCCLYMKEICDLEKSTINYDTKLFIARRRKKGRCLRVSILWDETIEALNAIPKQNSQYIFISMLGTTFSRNGRINDFADWRNELGLNVGWSHIRDGAYTTACNAPGVEEKYARIFAGHKAIGEQDKYVLRRPMLVKGAVDAVYKAYFS